MNNILSQLQIIVPYLINNLKIALDLGTSNTRIAIDNKGIVLRESTFIGLDTKNHDFLFFGTEAKQILGKVPKYIDIIRPIENGVIFDFDANVALIDYFIKKSIYPFTMNRGFLKPNLVCYTAVPSSSTEVEQKALVDSLLKCGFSKIYLIEKPIVIAAGLNYSIFSNKPVFIVDLGGGLIEMAIITLGGIINQKIYRLAGEHMDKLIHNYILLKYGAVIGEQTAENLKIQLFDFEDKNKILTIRGKSLENRLPKSLKIKSNDIREALIGQFNQILDLINELLEATAPEIIDEIIKNGIILTGGLTNIKGIDKFFSRELKIPIIIPAYTEDITINGLLKLINYKDNLKRIFIK
jgi:rod shape-determining protein MreB